MRIKLDFNSPEAIYIQLRNQIVMQIAQEQLHEGDSRRTWCEYAYGE